MAFYHIDDDALKIALGGIEADVKAGVFEVADDVAHLVEAAYAHREDIRRATADEIAAFLGKGKAKAAKAEAPTDAEAGA